MTVKAFPRANSIYLTQVVGNYKRRKLNEESSDDPTCSIDAMPRELILQILLLLPFKDVDNCSLISKRCLQLSQDSSLLMQLYYRILNKVIPREENAQPVERQMYFDNEIGLIRNRPIYFPLKTHDVGFTKKPEHLNQPVIKSYSPNSVGVSIQWVAEQLKPCTDGEWNLEVTPWTSKPIKKASQVEQLIKINDPDLGEYSDNPDIHIYEYAKVSAEVRKGAIFNPSIKRGGVRILIQNQRLTERQVRMVKEIEEDSPDLLKRRSHWVSLRK